MLVRIFSTSLAALIAAGILAAGAQADHRKKQRRAIAYDHYYAGPKVVRAVPGLRLFFGDYALSEEEFDALYGLDDDFDESYYEPQPAAPPRPLKKTAKSKAAPDDVATASIGKAAKPASKAKTAQVAASTLSCDKAGSIVGGYGFTSVKAESCKGKVYAFNASRDGKPFAIKLDAASGELTEVKKLQ